MANIETLSVSMTANTERFQRSMRQATRSLQLFRSAAARVGAVASLVAGGGLAALAARQAPLVDETAKTSRVLGLTTEQLIGFRRATERGGAGAKQFDIALQRLNRRIGAAATGTGEAVEALKTLGLDARQLNLLPAAQSLGQVLDALDRVRNNFERTRLEQKLFDSEGVRVARALRGGSALLAESAQRARELGAAFSEVDAVKVEQAMDAFGDLRLVIDGVAQRLLFRLSPFLEHVANQLIDFGTHFIAIEDSARRAESAWIRGISNVIDVFRGFGFTAKALFAGLLELVAGGFGTLARWMGSLDRIWNSLAERIRNGLRSIGGELAEALADSAMLSPSTNSADLAAMAADVRAWSERLIEESALGFESIGLAETQRGMERIFDAAEEKAQATARAMGKIRDEGAEIVDQAADLEKLKIGEFREVDLSRVAIGGAAGLRRPQEVRSAQFDRMIELLGVIASRRDSAVPRAT